MSSPDAPKPGPHLHPSTRPATPAHTRPSKPAHTRPADPSFTRLLPFGMVDLPAGAPRQVGAKFAELAVDLDELAEFGGLSLGHTEQALHYLAKAREHALLALDATPVHPMGVER